MPDEDLVVSKSVMTVDGDNIAVSFGFTKVDKENRTVSGIATADNIDQEGDIIDFDGSKQAFKKWIGNIREMHGTKAVGKAVSHKEVVVKDSEGNVYQGFEVTSYISKGAQDTWEKILDGTLQGYSIGGRVLEKVKEFHKTNGKVVNRIKKYALTELSVVDNPCNPLAQFTMIKTVGGKPELSDVFVENDTVFYCETDEIAKIGEADCSVCGEPMHEIGFVQAADFTAEEVSKMIDSYELKKVVGEVKEDTLQNNNNYDNVDHMELTNDQKQSLIGKFATWLFNSSNTSTTSNNISYTFAVNTNTEMEDVSKTVEATEVEAETEGKEEVMEKNDTVAEEVTETVEEVTTEEVIEKAETVEEEVTTPALDLSSLLEEVKKSVSTAVAGAADGWKADFSVFGSKLDDLTGNVERVSKRLDDLEERVNSMGAVKKSIDADTSEEEEEVITKSAPVEDNSAWGNMFLPQGIIESLGYKN